jgi:hypothetical protein
MPRKTPIRQVKIGKRLKLVNDLAMNIEGRGHRHSLLLWPRLWRGWKPPIQLVWAGNPFSPSAKSAIPNTPGVYAFVVQPGIPPGMPNSVLMYIGMSDRPLRERFQEYLREMNDPTGRPAISTMLHMYDGYLHFYCASVIDPIKPKTVEDHLLETLVPPMNKQYPAKVSRIVGAFS